MNFSWDQLVKYISDSKHIAAAAFITSLLLLLGNSFELSFAPQLSSELQLYCWVTVIFTGSLLVISVVPIFYRMLANTFPFVKRWYAAKRLTKLEQRILIQFSEIGPETLYVYNLLDFYEGYKSADILQATNSLERKGFIKTSFDKRACWLKDGAEGPVLKLSKNISP